MSKCAILKLVAILIPTTVAFLGIVLVQHMIVIPGGGAEAEGPSQLRNEKVNWGYPAFSKVYSKTSSLPSAVGTRIGTRVTTAYTLGREEENDNRPCEGAYGDDLCKLTSQGYTICASREFKKLTLLRVGDIECIVLDRTNAKYSHRVDLAMNNLGEALRFGKKIMPVYIIGRVIYGTR